MKGQELKIIFNGDLAFLTEEVALDLTQVEISDSPVNFKSLAFWTVRVINHIENQNKLFVEVLSYQVGETGFSDIQIALADTLITIEKVTFKSIDTTGLLRTLHGGQPFKITPSKEEFVYREESRPAQETINTHEASPFMNVVREPITTIYNEPFSIRIKNVHFVSGAIAFEKKIEQLGKVLQFRITNEYIIEEYDAIKNYFENMLRTKYIQVDPHITMVDGVITSINATSIEIAKIDRTFVEEVKYDFLKAVRRKEPTGDKQLYTMDEYLETFGGEEFLKRPLFSSESEFFDTLLEYSETKHYNHLRFLSKRHRHELQKLRFINKPFSFVFLLDGTENFHIVWETLDTNEATYIWTVEKDVNMLSQVLVDIEKTITKIIREGKNEYINQDDANFNRVFHDYADQQNGFKNWKTEMGKVLV